MNFRGFTLEDFNSVIDLWKQAGLILSRSDTFGGMPEKLKRNPELFFVLEEDSQIYYYDGIRSDAQCQYLGKNIISTN